MIPFIRRSNVDSIEYKISFQDCLKFLAIFSMIIDHLGYYLFPDVLILRIIGRLAMPIFAFYVGYNHSTKRLDVLFLTALLVFLIDYINNYTRINILFDFILIKILVEYMSKNPNQIRDGIFVVLLALGNFYLFKYLEYGTITALFGIAGLKFKQNKLLFSNTIMVACTLFLSYITLVSLRLKNAPYPMEELAILAYALPIILFNFEKTYNFNFSRNMNIVITLVSRNTLLIYFLHIAFFHAILILTAKVK